MPPITATTPDGPALGTSLNDEIIGASGNNFMAGYEGNDTMSGLGGNDMMLGHDGDDILSGDDGFDNISGGNGNDTILGGSGKDTLYGDAGNDWFVIEKNADYTNLAGDDIYGGDGYDIIATNLTSGSGGITRIGKVSGVEEIQNYSATDSLILEGSGVIDVSGIATVASAGGSVGLIWGQGNNDTIRGFNLASLSDSIYSYGGHDAVYGMAGNDFISGGVGNDTLAGDAGNDTLAGDAGNDRLIGGADSDTFRFIYNKAEGSDTVADYVDGVDKFRLIGTGGTVSFADLTLADSGADCIMTLAGGTTVRIVGVNASALDAGDFIFA